MKKILAILILIFTLQTPSQADDIRDFQIEGMSIGDSALDFFTERQIKDNSFDYYNDKLFTPVQTEHLPFFNTYDGLDFDFKTNDKDYIIHALYGRIDYPENIKDCYKKMDEIDLELSEVFKNGKKLDKYTYKHSYDKSGESTITDISFQLNDGVVILACYDWSEKQPWDDHLRISVRTKVYATFLIEDAYK